MIDLRGLGAGDELTCDVCIVGAGPAGLAVAEGLRGSGRDVLVLDSGGASALPEVQDLGVGEPVGDPRYVALPLSATRQRRVGGTANAWDIDLHSGSDRGVRLVPFSEVELRPAWGTSWPLTVATLEPHYRRAHHLLGLPEVGYEPAAWTSTDARPLDLEGVRTGVFLFAAGERISVDLVRRVTDDGGARLGTHGTVTDIEIRDDRAIGVIVTTAPGRSHRVRCRDVVLAAGGIENARLLLASSRDRGGLGNRSDHVGRWFMDHPLVRAGMVRGEVGSAERLRFYDHRLVGGVEVMGRLVIPGSHLGPDLPGSAFYLLPRPPGYDPDIASALVQAVRRRDVRRLLGAARGARSAAATLRGAWLRGRRRWPEMSRGGWSVPGSAALRWPDLELVQRCEQVPDRSNRVVLSARRDRLGQPAADVHWTWTEQDRQGVAAAQEQVAGALRQIGWATTSLSREPDGSPRLLGGTHHHIGTTRMAAAPTDGVVDPDGRLHDVRNVWVAGSSVFPTSGTPNPTLTILALALRLADRLRR